MGTSYDKIFLEMGKIPDNLMVTENRLVSGVNRLKKSVMFDFLFVGPSPDNMPHMHSYQCRRSSANETGSLF